MGYLKHPSVNTLEEETQREPKDGGKCSETLFWDDGTVVHSNVQKLCLACTRAAPDCAHQPNVLHLGVAHKTSYPPEKS